MPKPQSDYEAHHSGVLLPINFDHLGFFKVHLNLNQFSCIEMRAPRLESNPQTRPEDCNAIATKLPWRVERIRRHFLKANCACFIFFCTRKSGACELLVRKSVHIRFEHTLFSYTKRMKPGCALNLGEFQNWVNKLTAQKCCR